MPQKIPRNAACPLTAGLMAHNEVWKAVKEGDAKAVEPLARDSLNETWREYLACRTAQLGQTECLRVLFKIGFQHQHDSICVWAASSGQLSCLRLAYDHGLPLKKPVATAAASGGHAECLAFALEQGPDPDDIALATAVSRGHVRCVELLVAHGFPKKPYHPPPPKCSLLCSHRSHPPIPVHRESCGRGHLRCLQHLLDKRCPIDPATLIWAARRGDVDCVRLLHSGGVPLWDCVWEEPVPERTWGGCPMCARLSQCKEMKVLAIPRTPEDANHMWEALMYGSVMGAPLTPRMEEFLKAKRRSTRAVLLSFHAAAQLSQGPGTLGQGAAWAAMSRMPLDLLYKILVLAEFEIPESLHRSLFGEPRVRVRGRFARPLPGDVWEFSNTFHQPV